MAAQNDRATGLSQLEKANLKLHLRVADHLGMAIARGDFKPGALLPAEVDLCEALGVSRTAVREAVRGLIAKGLVESRPKRGTCIREPEFWSHMDPDVLRWQLAATDTESYLVKMFQLRRAVEPTASAIAAEQCTAEDKARLSVAFAAMVAAGDDNDAWVDADLDFHHAIYLATHNEFFWPIGQLFSLGLRQMFVIAAQGSHRQRAIAEHGALADAILAHRPEDARAAALTLLGNAVDDIDRIRSGLSGARERRAAAL
ncbi:FadR family transcriptional regulator [Arsenicitalea aurantiaca]|uniref:FadR family transcriptional regulator n=1 Tax=Arsenicitalea aurantiaca TaxID=1783274 RepID=A0A433XKX6_9HYPH|nr:FadR/GntR family transcriptional regulator [Arsenicitalea aurantiaca]RUT34736.1 FadR family transcriptional regulator [Arsenicitalea aurantiaca]